MENWHVLQELAGTLGKGKETKKKAPAAPKQAAANPAAVTGNGSNLPAGLRAGAKIQYKAGGANVSGVIDSVEPAVLSLDDNTEIKIPLKMLVNAINEGLVDLQ